jgi:hypothetical protein
MTKRNGKKLVISVCIGVPLYALWCLKPFFVSGALNVDSNVPPSAKQAVNSWYSENKQFGRVTPTLKGAVYFLLSPYEDSIPTVNVEYYNNGIHTEEVALTFRGNSQSFKNQGSWSPEDFQITNSANYFHPSNPRFQPTWSDVFFWKLKH